MSRHATYPTYGSLLREFLERVGALASFAGRFFRRFWRRPYEGRELLIQMDEAGTLMTDLRQSAPDLPAARHLQARMLHKLGRTRDAQRMARGLVKRWPKVAAFRLDAARFALRTDQLTEYLKQARYVVREDFGVGRSPGTMRDLLEILRIGGLRSLYERGLARTGRRLRPHGHSSL